MIYASQVLVEAYLKRSLTSSEITLLDGVDLAVKAWIDNQIESSFGAAVSSTKYYDGGVRILDIDPCTDITEVKTVDDDFADEDIYDADDYVAGPVNDTVKHWVEKRHSRFPKGTSNIAVTATFSFGDVPSDIEYIASIMVGSVLFEGTGGALKSESIEGYSRTFAFSLENGDLSKSREVIQSVLSKYTKNDIPMI